MMLDDSKYKVIKSLKPTFKTGKKWKVRDTIRNTKDNFAFKELIGHTQTGRQGFGTNEKQRWSKTSGRNRRDMIIQDLRSRLKIPKRSSAMPTRTMDKLGRDLTKVYTLEQHIADGSSQVEFSNLLFSKIESF